MYLENIIDVIKSELGIDLRKEKTRKRNVVDARKIYCDIANQSQLFTLEEVGELINRNYSTVVHSIKSSENLKDCDTLYMAKYNRVFDKTQRINTDSNIKRNYKYYKSKYKKYKELLSEVKAYEKYMREKEKNKLRSMKRIEDKIIPTTKKINSIEVYI